MLLDKELLEIAEAICPDIDLDDNPGLWDPRAFCEAADAVLVERGWPTHPYEEGSIESYFWSRFLPASFQQLMLFLSLLDVRLAEDYLPDHDAEGKQP